MNNTKSGINKFALNDSHAFSFSQAKFLIKPIGVFILIVALFAGSFYFGLGQVNLVRAKVDKSQKNQKLLSAKVEVLKSVVNVIPLDVTSIDLSLPSKGSTLYGMSQVKSQANSLGLTVSNLRTGNSIQTKEDGVYKVTISFNVMGDEQSVYTYLGSFSKLLPLMKIDKVEMSKDDGIVSAAVILNVFSGELPKSIPSITSPVTGLTTDEVKMLDEVSSLLPPKFIVPTIPEKSPKDDPFSL